MISWVSKADGNSGAHFFDEIIKFMAFD